MKRLFQGLEETCVSTCLGHATHRSLSQCRAALAVTAWQGQDGPPSTTHAGPLPSLESLLGPCKVQPPDGPTLVDETPSLQWACGAGTGAGP